MSQKEEIDRVVKNILAAAPFVAPELRAGKLLEYLGEHGEPLELALRQLPEKERALCGFDKVRTVRTAATAEPEVEAPVSAWSPPPGVKVEVLRGSFEGPYLVAFVTLNPGAVLPSERHPDHEEDVRLLSGAMRVVLNEGEGEDDYDLPKWGECPFSIESGVEHIISNLSATEPATYLSIMRRV